MRSGDWVSPYVPNNIRIHDCDIYVKEHAIKFFAIPNIVDFQNNTGMNSLERFYFDPTIPQADLDQIGSDVHSFIVKENTRPFLG